MEQLTASGAFVLGEDQRIEDLLEVEAELLRSEGLDPTWPGFDQDRDARRSD